MHSVEGPRYIWKIILQKNYFVCLFNEEFSFIFLFMIYHLTDIAHQEDLKSEKLLVWSDIDWARTAWN